MSMFGCVLEKFKKAKGSTVFVLLVFISFLVTIVSPYLNGVFLDFLIANTSINLVVTFALVIAAVSISGTALSYFASIVIVKVSTNTAYSLLIELMKKFERAELLFVEALDTSYITQRVSTDVNAVSKFVIGNFLTAPLQVVLSAGICVFFFLINQFVAFMALGLVLVYILLFVKLRKPLYDASMQKKEADSIFFGAIGSQLNSIFEIQLRSKYDNSINFLNSSFGKYYPTVIRTSRISYLFSSADGLIGAIFQSVLLVIAGVQIILGNMTVGEFTMLNAYFAMLLKCTKYYMNFFQQYQDAMASYGRILEMSDFESRFEGRQEIDSVSSLSLKNLSYRFSSQKDSKGMFGGLSFTFRPAISYAIIGRNGSGKSTLLKLLTGLYDPGESVLINDIKASDLNFEQLRSKVFSVVPQKLHAPNITVREYIADYSNILEINVEDMVQDQKNDLACYSGHINSLLDEECRALSGGELRKLNLWLAANKPCDVLILDEPTTGLDVSAKTSLIDYIQSNDRRRIIILMTHDDEALSSAQVRLSIEECNST